MSEPLTLYDIPELDRPALVLGFTGWMDGGDVSTGTVEYLVEHFDAELLAEIDPAEFYIYNFPGGMEVSALFRPEVCIENGLIADYEEPENTFYAAPAHNLVLFSGKEPNVRWDAFADCLFEVAATLDVREVVFVGSVSGVVPHTRAARLHGSVSEPALLSRLETHDIRPSNYEGPASFMTHLMVRATALNLPMTSLVAEVPPYVNGRNLKCIEAVCQKLTALLGLTVDLHELAALRREFERRLDRVVRERDELTELVARMEKDYDAETLEAAMDDLKSWFEKQGIRPE